MIQGNKYSSIKRLGLLIIGLLWGLVQLIMEMDYTYRVKIKLGDFNCHLCLSFPPPFQMFYKEFH